MSPKPPTKADIARKYRDQYGPEMPIRKLARIMFKENNILFKDYEQARAKLRYIEGKMGKIERGYSTVKNSKYFMENQRPVNPYKLPKSDARKIKPFLVSGAKKIFLLNDVHLPYHDVNALTVAFDYAKKEKPDTIVLNGDIIDVYMLSKFCKDPKARDFAYELEQFRTFFQVLQNTFPKAQIIFKFGNHELRYQHFLHEKASELVGVKEFEFENIIKARANGITVVKDKQIIKLNDLDVLHGHEFGRGFFNPVNAARGLHLRAKVSALQGDCHKTSEHTETDLHSKIKTTWSVGCLCSLHPEYLPFNGWNHGFAIIELDSNKKDFEVRNKRIYQGKVY